MAQGSGRGELPWVARAGMPMGHRWPWPFQALGLTVLFAFSEAFYLPGVAPKGYPAGGDVELKVNKLTSAKTQLPYGYYTLPVCKPPVIKDSVENLGEILMGDLIENSPYEIKMLKNETCKFLCRHTLDGESKAKLKGMIDDEYVANWMVDNLPAATRYYANRFSPTDADVTLTYMNGFPIGANKLGSYYVHNHVTLDLQYHFNEQEYEGYRIVGFEVEPKSIAQVGGGGEGSTALTASCQDGSNPYPFFNIDHHDEIIYTYDVSWTYSVVRWASRWDSYLKVTGPQNIHWFSILNSLMIMLFLSGMVAMILLRTLHRDISKYNEIATAEEVAEETGWKLVHGDVFRKPRHSKMLAVTVGSGVQVLGMSIVTLLFAMLGFLSPAHRGGLLQSMMLLYTFMGVAAGYTSARMYKMWGGDDWKVATLLTASVYPGIFFTIFFILNLFIWGQKSTGAVPFKNMFALLVLWFGISVPLVFLGSYFGFRRDAIEVPTRTNQIPRQLPAQQWYMKSVVTSLVGGLLPFGSVFTELFFIMSSLWQHQFYYLFGFLALVLVILLVTCAEISIAMTYFHLTAEDHRWWWISFSASASSAIYVFLYSILFFSNNLHLQGFVGKLLYIGYMSTASVMFSLLTGSIGCISSFFFVRVIYGSIKID
mmetsp:Transcript_40419/g.88382  ORF Transcript_40419/g.88382 Transcript_40419/m.88382 type:complete len:653 (+) Transcript_40419:15-1973(+)